MDIFSILTLIGGLAFFLYGMHIMSSGLESMAGGKLEYALKKMTANPFMSLLLGAGITIAIQSSSAVTVMLVGLVNSGVMELGQTICTGSEPKCLTCPIRTWCQADKPEELPVKLPKKEITATEHRDILCVRENCILLEKQSAGKRHEGMYRLPRRSESETASLPLLATQKYSITRYKVTRHLYQADNNVSPNESEQWIPLTELTDIPLASPDRKILQKMGF